MKQQTKWLMGSALGVLLLCGSVLFVTRHSSLITQHSLKAMYYCPMHPSYTSDHPGNCPICNMRLVKKETSQEGAQPTQNMSDICYLHNCPKVHDGRPCPMTVVAKAGEKVTCPICGSHIAEAAEHPQRKRILYWTDPMMPGYKSDKPGKSPMGMEMAPVYAEEGSAATGEAAAPGGYAQILLSPQKQQLIGVKTAPARRARVVKTIRASGTIAHDPELYQAEAEYVQAIHTLAQATSSAAPEIMEQAQRVVEASEIRLKHLGLNDALIQEIAQRGAPQHSLLFAHPGEPVWMYANVYENDAPMARLGQAVAVETTALPGRTFQGTIRAMDQMIEPMTRTTRIRAQLENPEGLLKPDMYVNASIAVDLGEVLAVPAEAVFATGQRQMVFVDRGQGRFEPREVTVGATADADAAIIAGLTEGEAVVTSGNFLIDSESRLKATLEGMSPPPAASAEGGSAPNGAGHSGQRAGGGVSTETRPHDR